MDVNWSYPIGQILLTRNELARTLTGDFLGKTVSGESFDKFVRVVQYGLPGELDLETLADSVRNVIGQPLTEPFLKDTAWRLAGNLPRLRRRRPVPPWTTQLLREWVPIQIMDMERKRNKQEQFGGLFTFQVLAGTPSSLKIQRWWSLRYCRYLSRLFKFSRGVSDKSATVPKFPFGVVEQLVTLRFYGLIDPALCEVGEPMFDKVKMPAAVGAWNLEQLRHRFRIDAKHPCPEGHPTSFPCHNCPLSFYQCRAATHSRTYVQRPCEACGEQGAYFDPLDPEACVACRRKNPRP